MPKTDSPKRAIANPPKTGQYAGRSVGNPKSPTSAFLGLALDMSWRLAVVVLVPIIGSYKLDSVLGTSPWLAIIGFLIAMTGMGIVMRQTYSAANQWGLPKSESKENK